MHTYGPISLIKNGTTIQKSVTGNNNGAGVIKVTHTCEWEDIDSHTPALNSALSGNPSYLLTDVTQEQIPGNLGKLTLTYTATSEELPATTYNEQSSQVEVPIQEHPDFSDWSSDWDEEAQAFKPSSDKYGITSYIKGSTTVTVTDYFNTKPASEKDSIGKTEAPGGDYGAAAKWLLIAANRSKQGKWWVMQKTYLYSANDWNSDIYG